jgi:hypothetical protein
LSGIHIPDLRHTGNQFVAMTWGEYPRVDGADGARLPISDANGLLSRWKMPPDLIVLQHFSRMERMTGIEPALSAWEEFLCDRVLLSCNGIGGIS